MNEVLLDVRLDGRPVGVIERAGRRSATYRPVSSQPRPASEREVGLSWAQPPDAPWSADVTHAWFENLLPESETRARIAGRFGLRATDTYGLLAPIGWECAGAVEVLPPDHPSVVGAYRELSEDEVLERLDALPRRPLDDDRAVRMSLGGGQSKMVIRRDGDRWLLPLDGAPSTHILKPEPPEFRGLVHAEAWSLALAATAAPAAHATVLSVTGHVPALVVTRYDRAIDAHGAVRRTHQEDGCQVLGVEPSAKYADHPPNDRQPSYRRMAEILFREARDPIAELSALLRFVTVNVALGNTDAHAKNVSFLHDQERLMAVAPLYDIAPTRAFIAQEHVAMPVAGRFRITLIGVEQLVEEARSWRLDARTARSVVDGTLAALTAGVADADARVPDVPERVRDAALGQLEGMVRPSPRHRRRPLPRRMPQ